MTASSFPVLPAGGPSSPSAGQQPGRLAGAGRATNPVPSGVGTARCLGCRWSAEGDPAATDKAAEKHTAVGHPTASVMEPVRRTA